MVSLAFITPVYKRAVLSAICMEQRRRVCDELREHDIDATAIYIGDDENIDVASSFGFEVVIRDNEWVGRKFSDGYEEAHKLGIDYVFAIGSDGFCRADMFFHLPKHKDEWIVHRAFSDFSPSGKKRIDLRLMSNDPQMGIQRVMHTESLAHCGYRPCKDELNRGCDTSTWNTALREETECVEHDCQKFELLNFTSRDVQITPFGRISRRYKTNSNTSYDPWLGLPYDSDLIDRVRAYYASGARGI